MLKKESSAPEDIWVEEEKGLQPIHAAGSNEDQMRIKWRTNKDYGNRWGSDEDEVYESAFALSLLKKESSARKTYK